MMTWGLDTYLSERVLASHVQGPGLIPNTNKIVKNGEIIKLNSGLQNGDNF
jgi:hypothetical protein